ncbi:methyltransferase [Lactobacillus sp. S2-2]|uniref:class I SAM-dependent methyltransferase n=1 Tax=Lactobacillus sp. S2-2 TaxID=2692917 RepID=UPI001F40353C|nr:class I SAM-dependent methyltransferase [Lactobacillus sp. S2-2]MCF6515655.1 methyltransferase [Lactobacillus sp. S2-2]
MSDFYYTTNPNSKHDEKQINFDIFNHKFFFTTDNGVFSKRTIDFGSSLLIKNVDLVNLPEGPILDLGCGYGPVGIILGHEFPNRYFHMTDVNNRALELANKNSKLNNVENVTIYNSSVYDSIDNKFAGIITNPPVRAGKKIVSEMIGNAYDYLLDNGFLFVVLQKKQGAPSAQKLMLEKFGNAEIVKKDKGYYILKSKKIGE